MSWLSSLSDIIFPRVCPVCGKPLVEGEELMCLGCLMDMPRIGYSHGSVTAIDHALLLEAKVDRAAALFRYRRNDSYARLIHKAKYAARPKVARQLGGLLAEELSPKGFFAGIDLILPVPLHWTKRLSRGYNQSEEIAKGISAVTGIPFADNLVATKKHDTQTRKTDAERQRSVSGVFAVINPEELRNKHVLVVDDVITTGATIRECCKALRNACGDIRISVGSIGFARSK